MNYGDGCFRGGIRAFKWTAAGGSVALPKFSSFNNLSRANGVNYDGSVIVGLDESTTGQWRGAFWKDGVVKLITRLGQNVQSGRRRVEGRSVHRRPELARVVEQRAGATRSPANTVQLLGSFPGFDNAVTNAISDDHNVITGYTTSIVDGSHLRRRSGPPDCTGPISTPS